MTLRFAVVALGVCFAAGVAPAQSVERAMPVGEFDFTGPSPWLEIRQERIRTLLPRAMMAANVDAWLTLVRENANDPLALHVGGENAGAL